LDEDINTMDVVFIKQQYFDDNSSFIEVLDSDDSVKRTSRMYVFISIKHNGNVFYVPLRSNIALSNKITCYSVPSSTKPKAGLDFRKALIINDDSYVQKICYPEIASSQMNKLNSDISTIENLFINYVKGYIKSASKKREKRDYAYKYSTLHNFHAELGIR